MKNHISICFCTTQYQCQRKCFFQSMSWKRHCVTHWCEQRGMDSYLPLQINQSDCKISSNCGKIGVSLPAVHVLSPDVKSERKYIEKQFVLRLCFFVNLPWLPIMPLRVWTGLRRALFHQSKMSILRWLSTVSLRQGNAWHNYLPDVNITATCLVTPGRNENSTTLESC